jgi:hypothetical protein
MRMMEGNRDRFGSNPLGPRKGKIEQEEERGKEVMRKMFKLSSREREPPQPFIYGYKGPKGH